MTLCVHPDDIHLRGPIDRTVEEPPIPAPRFGRYWDLLGQLSVEANADIYFRSEDGIRSFVLARRDFQSKWGNTPISGEVSRALDGTNSWLLYACSSVVWNNYALTTAMPRTHERGVIHRALAVLDTDPVSSFTNKSPPAWEGVWVGPPVLQVFKAVVEGVERCYFIGLTPENRLGLWEIEPDKTTDSNDTPIEWALESRSMSFNSPMDLKRLSTADFWVDRVSGKVRFDVAYRSDLSPCWQPWHCWDEKHERGLPM